MNTPRCSLPVDAFLAGIFRLPLAVVGILAAGALGAQPVAPAGTELVTSINQYWNLPAERKAQPIDFELACTVTYFDRGWKMLFVQDDHGDAAYVPYGDNPYPFKVGEAIVARGRFMPPSLDVSFEHAEIRPRTGPPLTPVDVTASIRDHAAHIRKYVSATGYVDWVRRVDERHMQIGLSVNGQAAGCWVLMEPEMPTPDLLDRRVRIAGVYNALVGTDGHLETLELLVFSSVNITVLGHLDDEEGFNLPATPINGLLDRPRDQLVRVIGSVVSRETGRLVRIRDDTGQIDLMTAQIRPLSVNDEIEAVGYPVATGPSWRLENAFFRLYNKPAATAAPAGDRPIALAAEVHSLSAGDAAAGRPVKLTGVVTWSHPEAPFFFIADSSGGICILRGESGSMLRSPGRNVQVEGVTAMGAFAPVVVAKRFERVSDAVLPLARQVSVEHALSGAEEAQWVEMRGYLRRVQREGLWLRLELATGTSDFHAVLPATEDVYGMIGSIVRLHGVCVAEADVSRKLTGIRLWVPGIAYVQVEEPAPADPFTVARRPVGSLGQFETVQSFNRRVRVGGVVLHHAPGRTLWIEEDGHALMLATETTGQLQPGDRVEAVGFLGRQAGRLALREAVFRRLGDGVGPAPQTVEPASPPDVALDGRLVSVTGRLLDSVRIERSLRLTVQAGEGIFGALLERGKGGFPELADGSQLRLTGVHEVEYGESGRPVDFLLRLRTADDVAVLEAPSWWTRGRILTFTGLLAFGIALFFGWNTVLRRRVREQTGQIRAQLERETRLQAELARAGKLESLGLLAGGIAHDFNNLLTVLMGNVSLIRLDKSLSAEAKESLEQAAKAAGRARDLTQQLLTFAKCGAPLRVAVSLPEVVREVAEFALRGSKVSCRFDLPADLWPADVDKGQIGQVVQNIVINALQAMPDGGVMEIALSNREVGPEFGDVLAPGRYLRLDLTDHGPGIPAADLGRIFDPYFTTTKQGSGLGLATVHSIVKKHAGHITAESAPARGTTFHIWLPAAVPGTAAHAEPVSAPGVPTAALGGSRVLVMDDEEFIRNLAASILKRQGCRVTTVADGTEALREYRLARESGEPYALVILDLTIPGGMGGRQTMEELLKLDPAVRAIVSSGYSNDLVLANYQAHGFRGMISKPYDVADFADTVERVLRGERA